MVILPRSGPNTSIFGYFQIIGPVQKVIKYTFKVRKSVKRSHTYLMLQISSFDFLKDLGSNRGLFDKLVPDRGQLM